MGISQIDANILDYLAAIGFERGAEVVNVHARQPGHQPVGAGGRKTPHNNVVDTVLAPARNHVVSLFQFFQERGNIVGVVLQVAVHGHDELARGVIKPGGQRRGLPEVPAQLHHQHAAVDRRNLFQQLVGAIARTIIHKHQFEVVACLFHHLFQAGIECRDVLFLIMERHDNGIFCHIGTIDAHFIKKDYTAFMIKDRNSPRKDSQVPPPRRKVALPVQFLEHALHLAHGVAVAAACRATDAGLQALDRLLSPSRIG